MVRPNADISHTLNGQVKDLADEYGVSLQEMYEMIIIRGLEELEAEMDDSAE